MVGRIPARLYESGGQEMILGLSKPYFTAWLILSWSFVGWFAYMTQLSLGNLKRNPPRRAMAGFNQRRFLLAAVVWPYQMFRGGYYRG